MKRRSMGMKQSKKLFTNTAKKTHWRNVSPRPMRGGIRL